jgi:solute carrier family 25 oxoglutarate transporter 11
MLVGATQLATYDQFKELYHQWGINSRIGLEFSAAMSAGLLYSLITMPFETVKNRMAFQKPDPVTKELLYKGTIQSFKMISAKEGITSLWSGFAPYYLRSGGHTVIMFIAVEELRDLYWAYVDRD